MISNKISDWLKVFLIGEIFLLIHLFPQTGLARIVYIPFYIILMILLTIILFRKIKDKELKKQIIYWIIFHFLILNFSSIFSINEKVLLIY